MSDFPKVVVKPKRARPFFGRHPWLYANAIAKVEGKPQAGDQVAVYSHEGQFIAFGLFNQNSVIRVRLYSWNENRPIDAALIYERVKRAVEFRHETLGLADPKSGCRLVFSEADELSGLTVDRYADVIVMQFGSLALHRFESDIVDALKSSAAPRAIVRRSDNAIRELEGIESVDGLVAGELNPSEFPIELNGLSLLVDPLRGQKTGAYLDQRENYLAAARFSKKKTVLDVYCHGGGFGLTAMRIGGAASLLGVDSSQHAIDLAKRNAQHNDVNAEFQCEDAVAALQRFAAAGAKFGMVILDPPKFARTSASLERAITAYERINTLGIQLVEPGGMLVTCSCSGLVDREMFCQIVATSAQRTERTVQILEVRGQAADHSTSAFCLETSYLKCIIAHIAK